MTNLLNISALARRTGVAPDTLRKWEQRYGVLRPARTPGGQRRYSERDVARVEWLRDRLREGWRIGEASRLLENGDSPVHGTPAALRQALQDAARSSRTGEVASLLDQAFAVLSLESALAQVLAPTLTWLGEAWKKGELTVAQEHAVTSLVRARVDGLLADSRGKVVGTAVLACAPGEQHDLGLLMLAVLLRADGWRVEYLGADTPVEEAVEFAEQVDADLLCLSATRPESLTGLSAGLEALGRAPGPTLVAGGAAIDRAMARRLGAKHPSGNLEQVVSGLRQLVA